MKYWLFLAFLTGINAQNQHLENGKLEPHREYDLKHVDYQITIQPSEKTFRGTVTHTLAPFTPTKSLKFDAVGLQITSVLINDSPATFAPFKNSPREGIEVQSNQLLPAFQSASVTIQFNGKDPEKGLYFVESSFGSGQQVWTQGEDMDTRYWLPIYDYPNDRTTCEGRISVPKPMQVIGNGLLVSSYPDTNVPENMVFHWKLEQSQVPYLIAFAAGEWDQMTTHFPRKNGDLQLRTFSGKGTPNDMLVGAHQELAEMMAFFETKFGHYPWPKYDQVFVSQFPYGGMENTTVTINNDEELLDESNQLTDMRGLRGLVSHELAHHWFGNLVTTRDWANLWLNEGFATYAEWMYEKEKLGNLAFQWLSAENADFVISQPEEDPMVEHAFWPGNDGEYHGEYMQGAAVIAWMHHILGDELFQVTLQAYLKKHQFDVVQTSELQEIIKDSTGKNLDWLFEQFVFKPGYPNLEVESNYDQEKNLVTLNISQTQDDIYRFPLEVAYLDQSYQTASFWVFEKSHEFQIPTLQKPQWIDLNPSGLALFTYTHEQEQTSWRNMASNHPHPFKRLMAFNALEPKTTVDLVQRISNEPSPEVRQEVFTFFLQSEEMDPDWTQIITLGLQDSDARVRSAASIASGSFQPSRKLKKKLAKSAKNDPSKKVQKNALLTLAKWDPDKHQEAVKEAMQGQEYEWFDFFPEVLMIYGGESMPWGFEKMGGREIYYLTHFLNYLEEEDPELSANILKSFLDTCSKGNDLPRLFTRYIDQSWNAKKSAVFRDWVNSNPEHAQAEYIQTFLKEKETETPSTPPEPAQN